MIETIKQIFYKNKSCGNFIKQSYLSGMFYFKENLKTFSKEFRILSIPLWKKKIKHGFEKYYLFGFVFFKSSSRKMLYKTVLKKIGKEYKHIFINFNCSGETYLFLSYINPPENSVFIATKKYHIDLCRMIHPDIECFYLPDVINLRSFDNVYKEEYNGKIFYNILPFEHFIELEKDLRKGKEIHYCEAICKTIGIKYTKEANRPVISEEVKQSALMKAKRIGLNLDNFVFLCPESQSNENPAKDYWINLTNEFYEQGYDIFINTLSLDPAYGLGKTCFLTFDEAYYIASLSKQIIGLRSGFIEVLTTIRNIRLTCLYTDFKDRGELKPIDAETVLKGFSLKKLPNVIENNISESICQNNNKESICCLKK
ncbi:TPA: hypothetical protein IAC10_08380 [Candidatus Scatousia excrementigallinarum]|uniref:Uncharacterized protein n=1 Tax=Candidatus Scatousia excrementigallinarum TaxID=2840935 RepID=A0A9D1EZV6_9BACT|nr:hypothetical protein [Candidatus Scatousia excrementigallinarum]